jgi:hypothetical protein
MTDQMQTESKNRTVVNSWNEWDPLKHVIVGRVDCTQVQAPEPAVQRDWPQYGFPLGTLVRPRVEPKGHSQTLFWGWRYEHLADALALKLSPTYSLPLALLRKSGLRRRFVLG